MSGAILTLNAGSSSIKVALFGAEGNQPLASGIVDRIGDRGVMRLADATGRVLPQPAGGGFSSHATALQAVLAILRAAFPTLEVVAVGHRVVHGGPDHADHARIDAALLRDLEALEPFAPLHQPHNLAGIRAAQAAFPDAPQVACFDTAFHRCHDFVHDAYALPRAWYERGVRRYGFHGISYDYIAGDLAQRDPDLAAGRVVVAHLGNGASACAIKAGQSVASTMGFSAIDGLPMGTRTGQLDPGVMLYLMDQQGMGAKAISDLLYKQSGLLGLSGLSNDMRTLEAAGTPEAGQAIDFFVTRIRREVAALAADMGGIDALVFTAGIGENSRLVRARVCDGLDWLGARLSTERNAANARVISEDGPGLRLMVIPTNEEAVIARATRRLGLR